MSITGVSSVNFRGNESDARLERIEKNSQIAKTAGIVAGATGSAALVVAGIATHKVNGIAKDAKEIMPKAKEVVNLASSLKEKLQLNKINDALKKVYETVGNNEKLQGYVNQIAEKSEPIAENVLEVMGKFEKAIEELKNDPKFAEKFKNLANKLVQKVQETV